MTLISFASSVFIARWLGPVQLGMYYLLNLLPTYSEKFGRVGVFDHAAIYFLGKKKYPTSLICGQVLGLSIVFSLLPVIIFYCFKSFFVAKFLKSADIPSLYLVISLASIPFIFILISLSKMMIGMNMVGTYNLIQVLKAFLFLLFSIPMWLLKMDYLGPCLATLLSLTLLCLIAGYSVGKQTSFNMTPNVPLLKDLFGYGWQIYFNTILSFIHQRIDFLIVAFYLLPDQVSFYSLAVSLSLILMKLPNALSGIFYARISQEESANSVVLTTRVIKVVFLVMLISSLCVAAFVVPTIRIFYGAAYLPLVWPFLILIPGTIGSGLTKIMTDHFYGQARQKYVVFGTLITTGLNVVLNILLIPQYGIKAAAAVSTVTYNLFLIYLVVQFCREWNVSPRQLLILDRRDIGLIVSTLKLKISRILS